MRVVWNMRKCSGGVLSARAESVLDLVHGLGSNLSRNLRGLEPFATWKRLCAAWYSRLRGDLQTCAFILHTTCSLGKPLKKSGPAFWLLQCAHVENSPPEAQAQLVSVPGNYTTFARTCAAETIVRRSIHYKTVSLRTACASGPKLARPSLIYPCAALCAV